MADDLDAAVKAVRSRLLESGALLKIKVRIIFVASMIRCVYGSSQCVVLTN